MKLLEDILAEYRYKIIPSNDFSRTLSDINEQSTSDFIRFKRQISWCNNVFDIDSFIFSPCTFVRDDREYPRFIIYLATFNFKNKNDREYFRLRWE